MVIVNWTSRNKKSWSPMSLKSIRKWEINVSTAKNPSMLIVPLIWKGMYVWVRILYLILCKICFLNIFPPIYRHIEGVHKIGLRLKCDFCDMQFNLESTLKGHIRNVHTGLKKDFKCRFCQAVFAETLQLSVHTDNIHVIASEWPCDFCDMGKSPLFWFPSMK